LVRDAELEAQLSRRLNGVPVRAFRRVSSTMEIAHQLAADGAPEGTLVLAERQETGRGRLGRTWISPEGGFYGSLILRPKRPAADIPQLSLVAGLAAAEAIRDAACLYPSIRWPNDLLLRGLKVGGILTEARAGAVVVGIGINVSTDPSQLPEGSTSLAAEGVSHVSREDILAGLCRRFLAWYDVWGREGFGPIRDALRPWIGLFGHVVHITAGSDGFEGTAQDLDEEGRLVVRMDSGVRRAFDMGEVTLVR